jgi:hypothetical protein
VQLDSELNWHSVSAQSISPSQSLSTPSKQLISVEGGEPQSDGQLQWFSSALQEPFPQQAEKHWTSEQSAVPLQSLSSPSAQFVSGLGAVPQIPPHVLHPPLREQPAQHVPLGQAPHETGPNGLLTVRQSGSLQSAIPSQSSSMGLGGKPAPQASVAGGDPQSLGQLHVVSGGEVQTLSPQYVWARATPASTTSSNPDTNQAQPPPTRTHPHAVALRFL